MSEPKRLADFLKPLDHEIKDCSIQLQSSGYKLDGNDGIKVALRIMTGEGEAKQQPKSCDYVKIMPSDFTHKVLYIEFSDLVRQRKNEEDNEQKIIHAFEQCNKILQQSDIDSCSSIDLSSIIDERKKSLKKSLDFKKNITAELVNKFSDTNFILCEINEKNLLPDMIELGLLDENGKAVNQKIFVAWHSIDNNIDMIRLLGFIINQIKANLIKRRLVYLDCRQIELCTIERFKKNYDK